MDFIHKKTIELSDKEIEQFCSLYSIVFSKHDKTINSFKEEYLNSALGYSYHALMFSEGELVGAHNEIPVNYLINGKKVIFCVGTDVMIKEGFRNFIFLKHLIDLNEKAIKKEGINFIFGFPNDKSNLVFVNGFKYRKIGRLNTYLLPYRIGGVKPLLKFLNPFSMLTVKIFLYFSKFITHNKPIPYLIIKDREAQRNYRLKWFNGNYKICELDHFSFVYKIILRENIRTAFLIDIDQVNQANIYTAIKHMIKIDRRNFDLIIYVGNLSFSAFPLLRVPLIFEPKKFNFIGKFLSPNDVDERLFEIENWNIDLSSYDLV